ncbi:MAG: hypothetical protein OXU64_08395 [Gemmatimonadota bacterium]|nr:hypothetical protein [Gemmatimonadota bacterium]
MSETARWGFSDVGATKPLARQGTTRLPNTGTDQRRWKSVETQGKGISSDRDLPVPDDGSIGMKVSTRVSFKRGAIGLGVAGPPTIVAVLEWTGWIPLWSWIKPFFAAIPSTAWWVVLGCLSHGLAVYAGWWIDRLLVRTRRITDKQAADLVRGSIYWSKLKRLSRVGAIQAGIDSEKYGLDTDPVDLHVEAINPPRHTLSVKAVLQQFADDEPDACWDGLYHRERLRQWLVDQAHDVKVPTQLRW